MDAELPWLVTDGRYAWVVVVAVLALVPGISVLWFQRRKARRRRDDVPAPTELDNLGTQDTATLEGVLSASADARVEWSSGKATIEPPGTEVWLQVGDVAVPLAEPWEVCRGTSERYRRRGGKKSPAKLIRATVATGERVRVTGRIERVPAAGALREGAAELRLTPPTGGCLQLWSMQRRQPPLDWLPAAIVAAITAVVSTGLMAFIGLVFGTLVIAGMSGPPWMTELLATLSTARPGGGSYKALLAAYESRPAGPERTALLIETYLLAGECEQAVATALWAGELERSVALAAACHREPEDVADLQAWALLLQGDVADAAQLQVSAGRHDSPILRHLIVAQEWRAAADYLRAHRGADDRCLLSWLDRQAGVAGERDPACGAEEKARYARQQTDAAAQVATLTGPVAQVDANAIAVPRSDAERDEVLRVALELRRERAPSRSSAAAALESYLHGAAADSGPIASARERAECRRGKVTFHTHDGWADAAFERACSKGNVRDLGPRIRSPSFHFVDALAIAAPVLAEAGAVISADIMVPTRRGESAFVSVDVALAVTLKLTWIYYQLGDHDRSVLWRGRAHRLAAALTDPAIRDGLLWVSDAARRRVLDRNH